MIDCQVVIGIEFKKIELFGSSKSTFKVIFMTIKRRFFPTCICFSKIKMAKNGQLAVFKNGLLKTLTD
jgi:hypothetical protein